MREKPLILVVDDDEQNLHILEAKLFVLDCDVLFARDGQEAVEKANQYTPDLILLDIMMPKMNGFQAARILKSQENTMTIPIVMITSLDGTEDRIQALEAGSDDFLTKPVNSHELQARVKSLLRIKEYYDKMHDYQKTLESVNAQLETAIVKANEMTAKAEATSQRLQKEKQKVSVYAREMETLAKERAKQLVHADRMVSLGTLSAGIAHEINNPTTFINVSANTMEKWWNILMPLFDKALADEWDKELGINKLDQVKSQFSDMIHSIKTGALRISTITKALKRFAREDHSEKSMMNIVDAVNTAVMMTKSKYIPHADLVIKKNAREPVVYGNQQQIEQVFINLIVNAADAIREKGVNPHDGDPFKGKVEIIVNDSPNQDPCIEIIVQDNGIGMDDSIKEKLFDPFFTTKSQDMGTGLGMSITYGIIKEHNGSIQVTSKKQEGTIITVHLPKEAQWRC